MAAGVLALADGDDSVVVLIPRLELSVGIMVGLEEEGS
jgi:hypothetical protein